MPHSNFKLVTGKVTKRSTKQGQRELKGQRQRTEKHGYCLRGISVTDPGVEVEFKKGRKSVA